MANVDIRQVRKVFGKVEVIHGIDLTIRDGEFAVLVGPSGCGKSTLLRMIAGLESVSGGEIDIGGTVVNDLAPRDRDIAMVFQDYALYPHKSVYDNMAFGLKMRGAPASEIAERVKEAAEVLQIGHLLDRKPGQLSGGQRQRVAMGRAIVRRPKVSSSTSRSRTSTPSCAARCASRSRSCTSASAPRSSTSRTTRSRR